MTCASLWQRGSPLQRIAKAVTNREQFGPGMFAHTWKNMFYTPGFGVDGEPEGSWKVCKSAVQALQQWGVAEGTLLKYMRHVLRIYTCQNLIGSLTCNADKPIFGSMAWGFELGAGKNACCRSLHFTGVETALVESELGEDVTLNPYRALVWYMVLGGWYKSFGIAGDNAYTFPESILDGGDNLFKSLFSEDDMGPVSEPILAGHQMEPQNIAQPVRRVDL